MADTINYLCLVCGEPSYLTQEEATSITACSHCGDTGIPANLDDLVTVTLTKHELRILTFWSEAYARMYGGTGYDPNSRMPRVLKTILDRVSMQTETAVSLGQDLANYRSVLTEKYGDQVDLILVDTSGRCLECHAQLDMSDDSAFAHTCGVDDEHPSADDDEESTPPYSS